MSDDNRKLYTIPKGAESKLCPRGCGVAVYWIEAPRAGKPHSTVNIPIDTQGRAGVEPDSFSDGRGINHFDVCEAQ